MLRRNAMLFGLGAGLIAAAILWVAAPALQGPRAAVESEASLQLERARRLLHGFDHQLHFDSLLAATMRDEGIEPDPDMLGRDAMDEYQRIHQSSWEAYPPRDYRTDYPSPARPSYGNIASQVRQGLETHQRLSSENRRRLDQALRVVDEALALASGTYSARDHAEANRLKGVILYHQGLARWLESQIVRDRADAHRVELRGLASEAEQARLATAPAGEQEILDAIARLEERRGAVSAMLADQEAALARMDEQIARLDAELQEAIRRRDRARAELDSLKALGADLSAPDGVERFRTQVAQLSAAFREAAASADALQFGTLPQATLDPRGDYLTGRFFEDGAPGELTVRHGLRHFHDERAVAVAAVEAHRAVLGDLQDDLSRLQGTLETERAARDDARRRLEQIARTAGEIYDELNRLDAEAFVVEDDALSHFEGAAQRAADAARYTEQWIREARDHTQNLAPGARERSAFSPRQRSGWMAGFVEALEADAALARAWIHYVRFAAYSANAKIVAALTESTGAAEMNAESERRKAEEAREAGVEQIAVAMGALESAHRQAERHWTLAAQAAGATWLMTLFGYDDYLDDAIESYREAVKGREDQPAAEAFVSVLRRLERR